MMRDSLADQLRNWKGHTMSNTPPPKKPIPFEPVPPVPADEPAPAAPEAE